MLKLDLRKELKYLYAPSAKNVGIVQVPRFQFAMLDGLIEAGEGLFKKVSGPELGQALREAEGGTKPVKRPYPKGTRKRRIKPDEAAKAALGT